MAGGSCIFKRYATWLTAGILAIYLPGLAQATEGPQLPALVIQVGVANPTSDKPQSKLWFAHGSWWAWLPTQSGSGIWRRTSTGWQRQTDLDAALAALPGRADVWAENDIAQAVLVEKNQLAVVTLRYSKALGRYLLEGVPARFELDRVNSDHRIETATIARDGRGRWWIAYPWQQRMWVRTSLDTVGHAWGEPIALSEEAAADDICTIVRLPGGVGLIWSDQQRDQVCFRWHGDAAAATDWRPSELIDQGGRTADDHLNVAVAHDGTLYLATKNSVDQVGVAQLVLRVRHPDGRWENLPYAPRTTTTEPSRPIVQLAGAAETLLLAHTLYGRGANASAGNSIVWNWAPRSAHMSVDELANGSATAPVPGLNNITGSKRHLPPRQPWLVLASDAVGRVYEIQLGSESSAANACASAVGSACKYRWPGRGRLFRDRRVCRGG